LTRTAVRVAVGTSSGPYALDPEHAKTLWARSEELVGERF
jgi:hypothetical protein